MKTLLIVLSSLILVACGGGSGSSGGGAGAQSIVFSGTAVVTFSAPGFEDETDTLSFTITLTGNNIEIDNGVNTWSGTLNPSGSFSVSKVIAFEPPNDGCTGPITWAGTITGSNGSGTVSGTVTCLPGSMVESITTNGTWTAVST